MGQVPETLKTGPLAHRFFFDDRAADCGNTVPK